MSKLADNRIPTYNVADEFDLLLSLPDSKPSKRIVKTKKGLKAIKALEEIKRVDNHSWYKFIKKRNINNLDALALFYRGNKITFGQFFDKVEELKKSLSRSGLVAGDEIAMCVSNTPEFVYLLGAASDLGLKVHTFGSNYDKKQISDILSKTTKKVVFMSDDNYGDIKDIVEEKCNNIVLYSLADSLPEDPTKCDEYEPELDKYYHYENKAKEFAKENNNITLFTDYIDYGKDYDGSVIECGDLETDFLVTYTSGSTNEPKAMIHKNRSLITMGKFHDPELCGNPRIPGLRGLAVIHPDSNTNIITCISDNLCQGWSVALEPEYGEDKALDILFLNKPNYVDMTKSHILKAAKDYLYNKRFFGRLMPFLLALFAVGERTDLGEEKLINKFLRKVKAGSGIKLLSLLRLPFAPLSIGGGDCEHGGIFYTLWKSIFKIIHKIKMGKNDVGMLPVPYAIVTALKKDYDGKWVECDYDEPGIVVANSYTNLSCYKDNKEATENLIIEDNLGRKWVTCNVYGYIDKVGGVHVNGRIPTDKKKFNRAYLINEFITKDTKNILSCETVEIDGKLVCTIQFQPGTRNEDKVINSLYERLSGRFHEYVVNSIYIRILPFMDSYPTSAAGKRSTTKLEQLGMEDTELLTDMIKLKFENQKKLVS